MNNSITIKTNNVPRKLLCGHDLKPNEIKELDYCLYDNSPESYFEYRFFRYKGNVYDINEFMRVQPDINSAHNNVAFNTWHGVQSDSYFSGVLIKYCDEYESVIVARYYC